jgi:hypothetical protein
MFGDAFVALPMMVDGANFRAFRVFGGAPRRAPCRLLFGRHDPSVHGDHPYMAVQAWSVPESRKG